ncbi:uncharacterized protein LOC112563691 [Pomacea canaliculata]|uniref:uncharacterized protein LOC112563691 n=1 Tax=Pomacea canaliculata TaxID=400727 RepID=UPI000D7334F2|nr:uncharacterized protein LOC112563691 [Pomacea canaliculata]
MSPKLGETIRSLLESINRVMGVVSNQMHYVHNDNDYVFNGTRYVIMTGVREQLKEIAKASDIAYDAVLRATLLTKDIYIRAHRGRLTGPTTRSLSRPEMSLPSLYTFISKAYSEDREAQQMLRDIQNYKRQQQRIQVRLHQIREKLQNNHAPNSLRTVVYYVNMTNHKLRNELNYATRMRNSKRNNIMLDERRHDLLIAKDLLTKADDHLAKGSQDYRGNYQVVQDFRRLSAGKDEDNVGPPVSLRRRPPDNDVTAEERRQILQIIDRVREHARQQEERARQIERILQPAIRRSQLVTKREGARDAVLLTMIGERLTTDGKKLFSLLDTLRVLVGSQQELRWRPPSELLGRVEGSGDDEDDDDDYEGCGSGVSPLDFIDDEDFVFVDEKKPTKRPSSTSAMAEFGEKLSVYLDGVNLRSNDVVQRADQVYDRTTEAAKQWQSVEKVTEDTATAYKNWKDLKPMVQNFIVHADNTSKMAKDLSERVNRFHSSVKERMDRAVHIAERALAKATVNKTEQSPSPGQPETDKVASDDASVIIEAFQKVSEVRSNTQAIANIRKVLPRTCDQATRQIQALRDNISHLRLQVQRARELLQSMQLSVAKTGNGYLSIPACTRRHHAVTHNNNRCLYPESDK